MRSYSTDALAAITSGEVILSAALKVVPRVGDPIRIWGGHGPLTIEDEPYEGLGDRAMASVMGGALGAAEDSIDLSLSSVDPAALPLVEVEPVRDAPAVLFELVFDGSGANLLNVLAERRGRLDRVLMDEEIGGEAVLTAMLIGAARGLGSSRQRHRTDADQRLVSGTDGAFKRVGFAAEKVLNLGGGGPVTAAEATRGGGANSGGFAEARTGGGVEPGYRRRLL